RDQRQPARQGGNYLRRSVLLRAVPALMRLGVVPGRPAPLVAVPTLLRTVAVEVVGLGQPAIEGDTHDFAEGVAHVAPDQRGDTVAQPARELVQRQVQALQPSDNEVAGWPGQGANRVHLCSSANGM